MDDDRPDDPRRAGAEVPPGAPPAVDPSSGPDAPRRRGHRRAVGGTAPPGAGGVPTALGRSRDDTDEGWGDRPAPDDDDRLLREVPPHW